MFGVGAEMVTVRARYRVQSGVSAPTNFWLSADGAVSSVVGVDVG